MKAIHGGKAKTDKIDAHKIAVLLRGGMLPQAYVYPKGMRETRDLLRRRTFLVRRRAEALDPPGQHQQPVQPTRPCAKKLAYAANRAELDLAERFDRPQRPQERRGRPGPDRRLRRADRRAGAVPDAHRQGG